MDRAADPKIAGGEHVGTGEVENQEHFRRPATDPLDLDQLGHHVLVGELAQAVEIERGRRRLARPGP